MSVTLVGLFVVSFAVSLFVMPRFKAYLENSGIVDMDVQKQGKPWMASSGGLPVIFGFLGGVLAFVFLDTFVLFFKSNIALLFASALAVMIATAVGLLDDIHVRRKKIRVLDGRKGLLQWQKPLLTIGAAVPLMAMKAGVAMITVPFVGGVDFGILYPLLLVPLAVVCVTNATNMLAGVNGLEAGMGAVMLLGTAFYALGSGTLEAAIIAVSAAGALVAFLIYNFHPARMLPGDSLTYLIGAAFVSAVIVGNIEKFGVIVFAPWIIEAFLKLRAGFKASSVGVLQPDGTLQSKHDKIYSLTHVGMRLGWTEKQIATRFILGEALLVLLAFKLV